MNIANAAGRLLGLYKSRLTPPAPTQVTLGPAAPAGFDPLRPLRLLLGALQMSVIVVLSLAAGVLLALALYLRVLWLLLLAVYRRLQQPASDSPAEAHCVQTTIPLISRRS